MASEEDENTSSDSSSSSSSQSSGTSASMPNEFFIDSGLECSIDGNPPPTDNLWPGSSLSVVATIAILFSWFSSFPGVSKEAFSHLLHILHKHILPSGNILPATYTEALSAIRCHLVDVQEFHCCVNDCIVYRGAYKDLTQCPHCQESRYFEGGHHVPRKRFKYIPFGQRVRKYFSNKTTSQLLQRHNTAKTGNIVHDIHETQVWKEWYSKKGIFKGDSRGLALSICLDGTNPFSKEKNQYSMWPMMVSILNLPANLRRLPGFLMLAGIIPGKSEPKNTDPYLDIFVDELIQLNGSLLFDAHQNNTFSLQTAVMLHVLDYPGQNKVFHCQGTCTDVILYISYLLWST